MEDIVVDQAEDFAEASVRVDAGSRDAFVIVGHQRPILAAFAPHAAAVWERHRGAVLRGREGRVLDRPVRAEPIPPPLSSAAVQGPLQAVQSVRTALVFGVAGHRSLQTAAKPTGDVFTVEEAREASRQRGNERGELEEAVSPEQAR